MEMWQRWVCFALKIPLWCLRFEVCASTSIEGLTDQFPKPQPLLLGSSRKHESTKTRKKPGIKLQTFVVCQLPQKGVTCPPARLSR